MAISIATPPTNQLAYSFAGVRLDTAARRLWVDEIERRTQPLVFNLLWMLCEQPRQVIPRDVLFQRLWPDGSFPSDESLSQIVFKLRNQLGPYGGAVVTVRHVGLRLDADVRVRGADPALRPELAPAPAEAAGAAGTELAHQLATAVTEANDTQPASAAEAAAAEVRDAPSAPAPLKARARWRLWLAITAAVFVALHLCLRMWFAQVVDPGFGLRVADLGTWRPASISSIRAALAADTQGQRSRAVALMEAVDASDPDTPIPALFLATWWAQAGDVRAASMAERYRQRLGERAPAFVHLLGRHLLGAVSLSAPVGPAQMDLLLAERPAARRLLLARAHWHLGEVENEAALRDLRAIVIDDLADRAQVTALLDRIALGDSADLASLLASLPTPDAESQVSRAHIDAWLALAAGDVGTARARLVQGIEVAAAASLVEPERRLQLAAAVVSGRERDFAAVRHHLGRARVLAMQQQRPLQAVQAGLLLVALPDWDGPTRETLASELIGQIPPGSAWECLDARLVYALSGLAGEPCPGTPLPSTASLRGVGPTLRAYEAWQQGDASTAGIQLDAAIADGAESGLLAPFVRLLAARLGRSTASPAPGLQLGPLPSAQATDWWAADNIPVKQQHGSQ